MNRGGIDTSSRAAVTSSRDEEAAGASASMACPVERATQPYRAATTSRVSAEPASFAVLRTPLLSLSEYLEWSDASVPALEGADRDTDTEHAWSSAVSVVTGRLLQLAQRQDVAHALLLASPSLAADVSRLGSLAAGRKSDKVRRALVRYVSRMATRATPFGLCAGWSLLAVTAEPTQHADIAIEVADGIVTRTRLDFECLAAIALALTQAPAVLRELRLDPNSSLHRVGRYWHFVESRARVDINGGPTVWTHHLARVEADESLDALIGCARGGLTFGQIRDRLAALLPDETRTAGELEEYIQAAVDEGVLVAGVSPLLTGGSALSDLVSQLEGKLAAQSHRDALLDIERAIRRMDDTPVNAPEWGSAYRDVESKVKGFGVRPTEGSLVHVDMERRLSRAAVSASVFSEAIAVAERLASVTPWEEPAELTAFREKFRRRYDGGTVPLLEVMDEEVGIGFGRTPMDASPLLHGVDLSLRGEPGSRPRLSALDELVLARLAKRGDRALEDLRLDLDDVRPGPERELPDCFSLVLTLLPTSTAAATGKNMEVWLHGAVGPSGANLMGRFCATSQHLADKVRGLLADESDESADDAVFAEVVHAAEGRSGNVVSRPVLRQYEIPYLSRSGAPAECQISPRDLLVRVTEGGRIDLLSERLGCRVIPRSTTAHAYGPNVPGRLPLYRFLCVLQGQREVPGMLSAALTHLAYRPRISIGRVVLAPRAWRIGPEDCRRFGQLAGYQRHAALQSLRMERGLPRVCTTSEGGDPLAVDWDNVLSVDVLGSILARSRGATLEELLPASNGASTGAPGAAYVNEVVLPVQRRGARSSPGSSRRSAASAVSRRPSRRSIPGDEWAYVKIYGSEHALDGLLHERLAPIASDPEFSGCVKTWFFLRYADPEPHLRVRFKLTRFEDAERIFRRVTADVRPLVEAEQVWRIQWDTYVPEVERYGGERGLELVEELWGCDSVALVQAIEALRDCEHPDYRWYCALASIHEWFEAFAFTPGRARVLLHDRIAPLAAKLSDWPHARRQLAAKFREHRGSLDKVCLGDVEEPILRLVCGWLRTRTQKMAPSIQRLRTLERDDALSRPLDEIIGDCIHVSTIRMMSNMTHLNELVLYDLLAQMYARWDRK
jgi:lantibiotic biosynthesis protein